MLCHHHKCIFIHIPKTAGQSIEHIFLQRVGLDWNRRAALLLRESDMKGLGPPRLAHLKASEYVKYKYTSIDMFNAYFKFAFVRNPWDRVVSFYYYLGYYKKYKFDCFVMNVLGKELWNSKYYFVCPQTEFIYDESGDRLVDYVGRFENLQEDFYVICKKINIPATPLPHNNIVKKSNINYKDFYDNELKEYVLNLYERDVEIFQYSF